MSDQEEYVEIPTRRTVCDQICQYVYRLPTMVLFNLDHGDNLRSDFNRILSLCGEYIDGGDKYSVPFEMSHELYCAIFNLARFRLPKLRTEIVESVDSITDDLRGAKCKGDDIPDLVYCKIFSEWPRVFGDYNNKNPRRAEKYARKTLFNCLQRLCKFWWWMENQHDQKIGYDEELKNRKENV